MTLPPPVGILRLPRGPDGSSRGFCPESPRARGLLGGPSEGPWDGGPCVAGARAALRERFLRAVGAARGRPARFSLRGGTRVDGEFTAADRELRALLVEGLRTPLGVEAAALVRAGDVLEFSFLIPETPGE